MKGAWNQPCSASKHECRQVQHTGIERLHTFIFDHQVEVHGLEQKIHAKLESSGFRGHVIGPIPKEVSDSKSLRGGVAEQDLVEERGSTQRVHLKRQMRDLNLYMQAALRST